MTDAGAAALAAGLRGLRHLSLAHNRRVSSASLPALAALTQLTALNLSEVGYKGCWGRAEHGFDGLCYLAREGCLFGGLRWR